MFSTRHGRVRKCYDEKGTASLTGNMRICKENTVSSMFPPRTSVSLSLLVVVVIIQSQTWEQLLLSLNNFSFHEQTGRKKLNHENDKIQQPSFPLTTAPQSFIAAFLARKKPKPPARMHPPTATSLFFVLMKLYELPCQQLGSKDRQTDRQTD